MTCLYQTVLNVTRQRLQGGFTLENQTTGRTTGFSVPNSMKIFKKYVLFDD